LWPVRVVGAFCGPFENFAFDDSRVRASSAGWVESPEEPQDGLMPDLVGGVSVRRGKKSPGRSSGGRFAGLRRTRLGRGRGRRVRRCRPSGCGWRNGSTGVPRFPAGRGPEISNAARLGARVGGFSVHRRCSRSPTGGSRLPRGLRRWPRLGPGSWSRPAEARHGSQCGRSARARRPRAKLGYEPVYPSATTSSNKAVVHRCGSLSRAIEFCPEAVVKPAR